MDIKQVLLRELNRQYYASPSQLVDVKLRELRFLKDGVPVALIPEVEQLYQVVVAVVGLHYTKVRFMVDLINEMFDLQLRDEKLLVVTAAEFDATLDRHDEEESGG